MIYAAYGSNLNKRQMRLRCPNARAIGRTMLPGWQLVMRGCADIERSKGAIVPVGLWNITTDCLRALDQYEGYPKFYKRIPVPIKLPSGNRSVSIVYVMNNNRNYSPAHEGYIRVCAQGYRDFGLDISYLLAAQIHADERSASFQDPRMYLSGIHLFSPDIQL